MDEEEVTEESPAMECSSETVAFKPVLPALK